MLSISGSGLLDYLKICGDIINLDVKYGVFDDYPLTRQIPYGNIGSMVGTLTFIEFILNKEHNKQVIEYTNENNFNFILKRSVKNCNILPEHIFNDIYMRDFINEGLKEFIISKIVSPHPAGIQAFDFKVTYIQQKHWLVTEFLMEKAGVSLTKYMNNPANSLDFVKYFTQLSSLMEHMEKEQIFYSDVKFDNCLVDTKGNFRIIDYDVTKAEGYYSSKTKVTTNKILGFSDGYVAPEIYNPINDAKMNKTIPIFQNVMPWRADIYSCGILGLCVSGAIDAVQRSNIKDLDNYKVNPSKHQFILDQCKLVKCKNDALSKKMQYVLEVCLSYDPKRRITFKQLHTIMMKIQDIKYDLSKLQQDVEFYRKENHEFQTKNQLKNNNEDLTLQINNIVLRNQELEKDYNNLNEKYIQTMNSLKISEKNFEVLKTQNKDLEE